MNRETIEHSRMDIIETRMTKPKIYKRKAHGRISDRLLIKCSDCDNQFEIYYDKKIVDSDYDLIEIAGVIASREQWKEILRSINL